MIGALVRRLREARGMTQVELAAATGIEQPNISAIENGRRMPTTETAQVLVEALGFELAAVAGDLTVFVTPGGAAVPASPPDTLSEDDRRKAVVAALEVAETIVRSR